MSQQQKTQQPTTHPRRCQNRANRVSWCNTQQKFCASPQEYHTCQNYHPKTAQAHSKTAAPQNPTNNKPAPSHTLLLGTKTGQCDICKVTKKILLLRYGFSLCEDCLNVCTSILEALPLAELNPKRKTKS